MPSSKEFNSPRLPLGIAGRAAWWLLPALLSVAGGCQQGASYSAAALPPQFVAPRFTNVQDIDFTRLARSVADSELIYPGDVIEVAIATGLEEGEPNRWKIRVAEDGTANIPVVGDVPLAGLRLPEAEYAVRQESVRRGKFVDPNVTVVLNSRRYHRVTVVGAVQKPDTYQLPASGSDLLTALVQAGGLSSDAGTVVEIRHPPQFAGAPGSFNVVSHGRPATDGLPRTTRIDLEQAMHSGPVDVHLEDGSTVMVMRRSKRYVHVIGLVKQADQFEMPQDHELRLLEAIALAGGRTLEVADEVKVIRQIAGQVEPVGIEASIRDAKQDGTSNIRLAAGDVVSVEETPVTFLVGTIRDFVRFGFTSAIPGF